MIALGAEPKQQREPFMAEKTISLAEAMGEAAPASVLSVEEIRMAMATAKARVTASLKEAETDRIVEQEMARLRREEGKRTGNADMDELVAVYIDLPEHSAAIRVNGDVYHHGFSYNVPRHMANSFREQMQRAYFHQANLDGKGMEEAMRRASPKKLSLATGAKGDYVEGEAA